MSKYNAMFKEEAVRLSNEIGLKQAAQDLEIPYHTLSGWRQKKSLYPDRSYVGSGNKRIDPQSEKELELLKENAELRRANEILKDALGFFAKDRKK